MKFNYYDPLSSSSKETTPLVAKKIELTVCYILLFWVFRTVLSVFVLVRAILSGALKRTPQRSLKHMIKPPINQECQPNPIIVCITPITQRGGSSAFPRVGVTRVFNIAKKL